MSKKLITVLLTVLTVMLLTGCNADKKAVTETAEGFLNAMVANDMEAAAQFATEEFMKSKTMKLMDPDYLADAFYASISSKETHIQKEDLNEEAQKAVDEYVRKVIEKAYESFEIDEMKVLEDTATVTAKITLGFDPEASSKQSPEMAELIDQYQTENYDELMEIHIKEGNKAMYRKLYNDLIPIIIGNMMKELESSEPSDEKTVLSLAKFDKKWLVTGLEENRPQAAAAQASGEASTAATTAMESEYAAEGLTENEYAEEAESSENAEEAESSENAEEGSPAGNTAESGNTSEKAAEAETTEGETGN